MEKKDILERLDIIFREVMDNDEIRLDESTTANDIEEWDSLAQIQLVVAIEKSFGIKFTSREILSWENVGEMIDSIEKK